jgi:hypothetical protein
MNEFFLIMNKNLLKLSNVKISVVHQIKFDYKYFPSEKSFRIKKIFLKEKIIVKQKLQLVKFLEKREKRALVEWI